MADRQEIDRSKDAGTPWRALAAVFVALCCASCMEPPPHLKSSAAVAKMTTEEKAEVVELALAKVEAEADPEAVQPSEIDWKTELAEMKAVLRSTDAQAEYLDRAFAEQDFELQLWMKSDKYARLLALETELRKSKDNEIQMRLKEELKPLRSELKQIVQKHRVRILTTMGEENRLKWIAHRLTERMRLLMLPLKLTDEQMAELRSRAWHLVEQTAGKPISGDIEQELFLRLERQIENEVLGPGQQRKYQNVKRENPHRAL